MQQHVCDRKTNESNEYLVILGYCSQNSLRGFCDCGGNAWASWTFRVDRQSPEIQHEHMRLAFVGRVLTTCDIVTSFIQAQWLLGWKG